MSNSISRRAACSPGSNGASHRSPSRSVPDRQRARVARARVPHSFIGRLISLYRQSAAGKEPAWVADWLDRGKPAELVAWQRAPGFKSDVPRVIRPDLLLLDHGLAVTELDSVPGGIGLTAWLGQVYHPLTLVPENRSPTAADQLSPATGEPSRREAGHRRTGRDAARV